MKYLLSVAIFVFGLIFTSNVNGQVGLYRTYDDYVNQNIEKYDSVRGMGHVFKKFYVIFYSKGEEVKVKLTDSTIWGVTYGVDKDFRMNSRGKPLAIMSTGEIYVYTAYDYKNNYDPINREVRVLPYWCSKGSDGEISALTKGRLKKFLEGNANALELLKKVKSEVSYILNFIVEYNEG